jgi:hypothetical protein
VPHTNSKKLVQKYLFLNASIAPLFDSGNQKGTRSVTPPYWIDMEDSSGSGV